MKKTNVEEFPTSASDTSTAELPTEATRLLLDVSDAKYLYGVIALMFQQSQKVDQDNAAAWGILGHKIYNKESIYSRHEVMLLQVSVDSALSAGNKAHEKAQDLPVRLRAATLIEAFTAIKGKLDNAEWKNVRLREQPSNLQGQDQRREQG